MKLENILRPFIEQVSIYKEIFMELQDEDIRYFWDVNRETFKTKYYRKKHSREYLQGLREKGL